MNKLNNKKRSFSRMFAGYPFSAANDTTSISKRIERQQIRKLQELYKFDPPEDALTQAALYCLEICYLFRLPEGTFYEDCWRPTYNESEECCKKFKTPTKKHYYDFMEHCYTYKHIANKFGVNAWELRKRTRVMLFASKLT